jgi:hypothetical protein
MLPYLGCAQETHQTAPSWLGGVRGVGEERGERGGWIRGQGGWGKGGKWSAGGGVAYPFNVSCNLCVSPSTSNIFTVRSEEQVARRRP